MHLDLDPGTSDMILIVHKAAMVRLEISGKVAHRKKSYDELLQQTIDEGVSRAIPDTLFTLKTLNTPHHHGVYLTNGDGPLDKTIEVNLKFTKVNYRVVGMADDVEEVRKVLKPGTQEFIMLEKINQEEPASVRTGFCYCLIDCIESEEQVIAKMLKNAETTQPDAIQFKGKPTEVYLHKLTLNDSIWLMWQNKCQTGPHAPDTN